MMPGDRLSLEPVRSRFVGARGLGVTKTVDYHDGGIAIRDASRGLLYQRWKCRLLDAGKETSRAMLSAPNTTEFELYAVPYMTEISLSFDQNMRPALAYVIPDGSRLWWYNSSTSSEVVTSINGITPRIVMDDGRYLATDGYQTNDIILAYKRAGKIYCRVQRDRFAEADEFEPAEPLPEPQRTATRAIISRAGGLIKIGQARELRLQLMMEIV